MQPNIQSDINGQVSRYSLNLTISTDIYGLLAREKSLNWKHQVLKNTLSEHYFTLQVSYILIFLNLICE